MIGLLQRVTEASVRIAGERVAAIGPGLLVLVAALPDDDETRARRLAERVLGYRVFADADGRMNRSVSECGGSILAVPQFTLAADTARGNRPGFASACPPDRAAPLFDVFVDRLAASPVAIETGVFGADMQVALVNDGPVTFHLSA